MMLSNCRVLFGGIARPIRNYSNQLKKVELKQHSCVKVAQIITGHPDNPKPDGTVKTVAEEVKGLHLYSKFFLDHVGESAPILKTWIGYDGDRAPGKAPSVAITATSMNTIAMMKLIREKVFNSNIENNIVKIEQLATKLGVWAKILAAGDTIYKPDSPQVSIYKKQFWIADKTPEKYLEIKNDLLNKQIEEVVQKLNKIDSSKLNANDSSQKINDKKNYIIQHKWDFYADSKLENLSRDQIRKIILDKIHEIHKKINKEGNILFEKLDRCLMSKKIKESLKPTLALAQPRLCATEVENTLISLMKHCSLDVSDNPDQRFEEFKTFYHEVTSNKEDIFTNVTKKVTLKDEIYKLDENEQNNLNLFQVYTSMGPKMVSELVIANTLSASQVAAAMCLAELSRQNGEVAVPIKPLFENLNTCQELGAIYTQLLNWDIFEKQANESYIRLFIAQSDMTLQPGFAAGRVGIREAVKDVSEVVANFYLARKAPEIEVTLGQGSSAIRGDLGGKAQLDALTCPVNPNISLTISATLQTNKRERILTELEKSNNQSFDLAFNGLDRANNSFYQNEFYKDKESLSLLREFFAPSVKIYHKTLESNSEFMKWVLTNKLTLDSLKLTAEVKGGSRDGVLNFDEKFSLLNQRAITAGILAKTLGIPLSFFGLAEAIKKDKENNEVLLKQIKEKSNNPTIKQHLEELRIVLAEINFDLFNKYKPSKELQEKFRQDYKVIDSFFIDVTGFPIKNKDDVFIKEVVRTTKMRAEKFHLNSGSIISRVNNLKTSYPKGTWAYHTMANK